MKDNFNKKEIAFLVVGFPKCGTTTFDSILRQHSEIGLPIIKETQLYHVTAKRYGKKTINLKRYYKLDDNLIKGAVEPSFYCNAAEIAKNFNPSLKIIFMMRNPINALYSYFKMNLRYLENKSHLAYYKNYQTNVSGKFDCYARQMISQNKDSIFHYSHWLKTFLQYYSIDNMKFIIFEDFCQNPEFIMDEVMEFLDLRKEKLNTDIHENSGDKVCRSYMAALINYYARNILTYLRLYPHLFLIYEKEIYNRIQNLTLTSNTEKVSGSTYKLLKKYYSKDVYELSRLIHINLADKWKL